MRENGVSVSEGVNVCVKREREIKRMGGVPYTRVEGRGGNE